MGYSSVLEGERLKAQNEIQFQTIVTNSIVPNQQMMDSAIKICEGEQDSSKDDCMKDFLKSFGQTWVVNLVDGSRTLLSIEDKPVAPIPGNAPADTKTLNEQ